jgi:hypothetical protein
MVNLNMVNEISLASNRLSGPIPLELGNMVNITNLHLGYNQLTGTVPSTLAELTLLTYLSLQYNEQLSGEIPSSLCSSASSILVYVNCNSIACSCCRFYNPDDRSITMCNEE